MCLSRLPFVRLHKQLARSFLGSAVMIAIVPLLLAQSVYAEDFDTSKVNTASGEVTVFTPRTGINASELAVVVDDSNPSSVSLGQYYQTKRGIPASNIIHVNLGLPYWQSNMSASQFTAMKTYVDSKLSGNIQAVALAWARPSTVENCMSITSAITFGFDPKHCGTGMPGGYSLTTCNQLPNNPLYNHSTTKPYTDLRVRPAMLIGPSTTRDALGNSTYYMDLSKNYSLIDRGVSADKTFPIGSNGYFVFMDYTRSTPRQADQQNTATKWNRSDRFTFSFINNGSLPMNQRSLQYKTNVLFYQAGSQGVINKMTNQFLPGALADDLTSNSGSMGLPYVTYEDQQMGAGEWTDSGATASYGTVVEPCAWSQKFSQASVLVPSYFSGATAVEAYSKSVQWLGEGLLIGEPLAKPFGFKVAYSSGSLIIHATGLQPGKIYSLYGANSEQGPYNVIQSGISTTDLAYRKITIASASQKFYKLSAEAPTSSPTTSGVVNIDISNFSSISNCKLETRSSGSNIGFMGYQNSTAASYVEYTISVPYAGTYALTLGLSTLTNGAPVFIYANSQSVASFTIASTGSWDTYQNVSRNIILPAGNVTLRIQNSPGSPFNIRSASLSFAYIGSIDISKYSAISNCKLETRSSGSDIGFMGYQNASSVSYVDYTFNIPSAGNSNFSIGIASVYSSLPIYIYVNSSLAGTIMAGGAGNWDTYLTFSKTLALPAGTVTLRIQNDVGKQFNIQSISLK